MSKMTRAQQAGSKMVAEISEAELACRLLEIACGVKRPEGFSAEQAIMQIEQKMGSDMTQVFREQARACVMYFHECIRKAPKIQ